MAQTIVIFGASGDLTSRKLLPAIYSLHQKKRLPADTNIVGFSRTEFSHDAWRQRLAESTAEFAGPELNVAAWNSLAPRLFYFPGSVDAAKIFLSSARCWARSKAAGRRRGSTICPSPRIYETAVANLGTAGMANEVRGPRRIVVEKPFGTDLDSVGGSIGTSTKSSPRTRSIASTTTWARRRCRTSSCCGLPTRSSSPSGTATTSTTSQITAAEDLTVGHRAAYYDSVGVLRDMFQNHLLQLMTLTAMEAPARFEADAVRDEKVKVLRCGPIMEPEEVFTDTLRGQYQDTARSRASGRAARRPPSPRSSCTSTIGDGKACPFSSQRQGHVLRHHPDW